jgi:uncharacterized membrane protein
MDENKWNNRMMHLTSFSLGVVVTAFTISQGFFQAMLYMVLISLGVLLIAFVYHYIRGIDHMAEEHPDYKGEDLFGEEEQEK